LLRFLLFKLQGVQSVTVNAPYNIRNSLNGVSYVNAATSATATGESSPVLLAICSLHLSVQIDCDGTSECFRAEDTYHTQLTVAAAVPVSVV